MCVYPHTHTHTGLLFLIFHYLRLLVDLLLLSHASTMQEAIPSRTVHHSLINHTPSSVSPSSDGMVARMVTDNAVIVIARRGCCMGHVVKRLLLGLGVNPAVYDVDDRDELAVAAELQAFIQGDDHQDDTVHFPAVFIGGKLFGGLDRLMATHISGDLIPILKHAGALWL